MSPCKSWEDAKIPMASCRRWGVCRHSWAFSLSTQSPFALSNVGCLETAGLAWLLTCVMHHFGGLVQSNPPPSLGRWGGMLALGGERELHPASALPGRACEHGSWSPWWEWGSRGDSRGSPALPPTGALTTARTLDREEASQHNLTVVATDHGSPRRSATQLLTVHVLDVNDEVPTFQRDRYEASVAENLPPGVPVLQLLATDRDLGTALPS